MRVYNVLFAPSNVQRDHGDWARCNHQFTCICVIFSKNVILQSCTCIACSREVMPMVMARGRHSKSVYAYMYVFTSQFKVKEMLDVCSSLIYLTYSSTNSTATSSAFAVPRLHILSSMSSVVGVLRVLVKYGGLRREQHVLLEWQSLPSQRVSLEWN